MVKQNLADKQCMLIINGPSCAGKTSVADMLLRYDNIFYAKYDALKWLVSNYTPTDHKTLVSDMALLLAEHAVKNGFSIISEARGEAADGYLAFAAEKSIPMYRVNVEAPWEVLEERFQVRIEAKKQGARISNVDPKRFKELYDRYVEVKVETELTFDSSKQSPEEIADTIVRYIRTH